MNENPVPPAAAGPTRRSVLAYAAGATGATVTAGFAASVSGCQESPMNDRRLVFASLAEALRELDRLANAQALPPATPWSWAQTLHHCAQSIEYSMSGFPQSKSPIFQRTAGALAFKAFSWRGRMSHNLAEPIPGAPALGADADAAAAVARLRRVVADFQNAAGPLRPHFAYGALSKPEYELAHAMHLANHFSAFDSKA